MAEPAKNRLIVTQDVLEAEVAGLVDSAPETLDTLAELAAALGDDPNFATTVSTQIGERAKTSDVNAALAGKADTGAESTATWAGVSGKPATFPPTIGSTAVTAKAGTTFLRGRRSRRSRPRSPPNAHTHPVSDVSGLQAALDGKAATSHTHSTAQVTGLDNALAGKASTSHTHPVTDLTATGTRSSSTYLRGDGSWATPTNTTYSVPTQAEAEAGTATTARAFSAQRVRQAANAAISAREWVGTQAQYNAIGTKNPNITYYIVD